VTIGSADRGRAPSVTLPLSYLVAAAGAFLAGVLGVAWLAPELAGHYYHPRVFALTHTLTLGWITTAIVGASYQLVPVVLGRSIWSERLARWQLVLLVVGIVGMVAHFLIAEWKGLAWAAAMVAVALAAHLVNVAMTVRGLARWTFTARLVVVGYAGLALTVASGLLLAVDKAWKFLPGGALANLHAHVHLAVLGWVVPMIVGVAARVLPMFLLAPEPGRVAGALQLWGLALGVPAVAVGLALDGRADAPVAPAIVVVGSLAVAVAIAAHLGWMLAMLRGRRRPALDWPLGIVLTGAAFLVPATLAGLALALDLAAGPRAALAYMVLGLGGWVSLTIVGMMLKIVPFLVWYRVYGPRAGTAPVPTLAALSWARAEAAACWLLGGGVIALTLGVAFGEPVVIRAAGLAVAAGALAFAGALAVILAHLVRRHTATSVAPRVVAERAS
jgi:hypothetical protein